MVNTNLPAPKYLFIETTTVCNYRCKQCHMWMSKEPPNSLSTDEKLELLQQFYQMNPSGVVVLTGGETMAKQDEFFALTSTCRQLGLTAAANTNGSYITSEIFDKTLTNGPKYLVISLDSHIPEIHDYIRGVKGSYAQVTTVIRSLVQLKKEQYPGIDTRIITNSILFGGNVSHWQDYIEFAKNDLQLDGVMFQALSRTFWNQGKGDPFFDKHFFPDRQKAKNMIDTIIEQYGDDPFLITSQNDLRWMQLYVDNPDFIGEQVCGSHEKNMMVDQMGDVQLCFSMRGLMKGNALGNVREQSLQELWNSNMAAEARIIMGECRKNCGMLNCHRKEVA